MSNCPCGIARSYQTCCEPLIKGSRQAETAEELMRARYVAHTVVDMDFVRDTHLPDTVEDFEEEPARAWAAESEWLGLEILNTEGGGPDDDEGVVEFIARFKDAEGTEHEHHEISLFDKEDGRWWFRDAHAPRQEPFRRDAPKLGRNDPCFCGSGKKFKKCCG